MYLEAAKKRGSIKEILPEINDNGSISEMWENIPISPSSNKISIGAGDGSFNKKKFLAFTFYAVGCESLVFDDEFVKIDDSILDTIEHHHNIDDLLRLYMGVLETKNAIKTIEGFNIDYYLFDGSLLGDLIRPFPSGINISKSMRNEILDMALEELKENIRFFNFKLQAPRIIEKYYNIHRDKTNYIMFLTSIEQLLLLKQLLKYKKKIIAVSKTSTNRDLFRSNIPDISIFDKYTNGKSGISKIIYKKVANEVKYNFLVENEFFKDLIFTIFYLRLDDNKNVLKVELPYRASRDEVLEIVKNIKKYSTDGYPYLLKKAHNDVVITNRDMDSLAAMVNLREKIGREMLR
ncbi:DNA double-strand break repair nuclease NurA [Methanobrevibacter sp.]|uniref:DNA double-strand break repair nuclease NurA n=1 Tax=Methanobrevibacter sp. TaxID=66852 RepID=UPI0026E0A9DE|nr:DNA double-strand break repair nuclease NurA [Methanobrevibacter sp.]